MIPGGKRSFKGKGGFFAASGVNECKRLAGLGKGTWALLVEGTPCFSKKGIEGRKPVGIWVGKGGFQLGDTPIGRWGLGGHGAAYLG
jgi:hypothetical protein